MEQIDKAKLLEWLVRQHKSERAEGERERASIYWHVKHEIEQGTFDPVPAPVPMLQKGDKVRHTDDKHIGTGVVLDISKSGLRARVDFGQIKDWDKKRLRWVPFPAYYRLDKLIKIEG